jgi:hypothetical protein
MTDPLSFRTVRRFALGLTAAFVFGASSMAAEDVPPKVGSDFQVNTFTRGDQTSPDAARFPDGRFVVVWVDSGDSPNGIKGRFFEASGAPASGEIPLVSLDVVNSYSPPRVAALPGGGFAVVWGDFHDVLLRRFDGEARPLGDPVVVNGVGPGGNAEPDVAADSAGNLLVVWTQFANSYAPVLLRRYDAAGAPQGDPVKVSQFIFADQASPRVAVNDSGSVLVSWRESRDVQTRRFDGPSGAWGPEVSIDADYPRPSPVVLYPEGDGVVVLGSAKVSAQRLDSAGKPLGALLAIDQAAYTSGDPDVAVDASGRAFVVWSQVDASSQIRIYGRLLDRAWQPLGDATPISSVSKLADQFPAVAAGGGGFTAVWANGELPIWFEPITPPRPQDGRDGDSLGVFAQAFGTPECLADSEVLCLGENQRFRAKVSWKIAATGETGVGRSHPLTADTGAFWFFGPDNLELMIKVLDGRAVNGHFWVFYGALSNVEYTITVTDTATGNEKIYPNPAGRLASRADTSAFADAGSPATASLSPPLPAAATACPIFLIDTTLCLNSGRFFVEVTFTDPRNGAPGPGHALGLTADSGAFWFFDPSNLELMVKVLDGRSVNGHFWVFFGALSNVAYTIRVTDTETGEQRTYVNPRGQLASRADTSAFPIGGD